MAARVEVPGGVLVPGRITAPHMATRAAQPQVNPAVADPQALFTTVAVRAGGPHLLEVGTSFFSHVSARRCHRM
jgi:hypothetical protein